MCSQFTRHAAMSSTLQNHAGMTCEYVPHVVLLVLAHDDEQQTAILQPLQVLLEQLEAPARTVRAELEPFQAHLADDAAPERVVAVERDDLRRTSARRPDASNQRDRQLLMQPRGVAAAREHLELAAAGALDPDTFDHVREVEQLDPGHRGQTARASDRASRRIVRRSSPVNDDTTGGSVPTRSRLLGARPAAACFDRSENLIELGLARPTVGREGLPAASARPSLRPPFAASGPFRSSRAWTIWSYPAKSAVDVEPEARPHSFSVGSIGCAVKLAAMFTRSGVPFARRPVQRRGEGARGCLRVQQRQQLDVVGKRELRLAGASVGTGTAMRRSWRARVAGGVAPRPVRRPGADDVVEGLEPEDSAPSTVMP